MNAFDPEDGSCLNCSRGRAVRKSGRYGEFYGCSNFPACKVTESIIRNRSSDFFLDDDGYDKAYYEAFYDGDG